MLKAKWAVLTGPPEYNMEIQARVPPAMAALHNFILKHDSAEWDDILDVGANDPNPGTCGQDANNNVGQLAVGLADHAEKAHSEARRDDIAAAMWESYQALLLEQGEEYAEE